MKKNITINYAKNTIEMTDAFAKAAGTVGSAEYKMLTETKREFPEFKITVLEAKSKKNNTQFKNLTIEYMEKFIREKNDAEALATFAKLRGMELDKENKLVAPKDMPPVSTASFFEIKGWFLETYHKTFEDYDKEVKDILKKSKDARATRKAA